MLSGFCRCSIACYGWCTKRRAGSRRGSSYCRYPFGVYCLVHESDLKDDCNLLIVYALLNNIYFLLLLEVLDTAAGIWLDGNGIVTSSRTSKGRTEYDSSLELMRRCRHASASVGVRIYIYGGLKGGNKFLL